jgi:CspA family cold shock protein
MISKGWNVATGTVKWFNTSKGFGFIAPDEGGDDVFVHISAVKAAGLAGLVEDQRLSYELQEAPNGRTAAGNLALL